jgi:hypothetical protein
VQRRERRQLDELLDHVGVDPYRLAERLTPVDRAVPDGDDLGQRRPVQLERVHYELQRLLVVGHHPVDPVRLAVGRVVEAGVRQPDLLHEAGREP